MNNKRQIFKYVLCDFLAAVLAWGALFLIRKTWLEATSFNDVNEVFSDKNFWVGIIVIPISWICLYIFQGAYKDVYRKSRLKELQQTAAA